MRLRSVELWNFRSYVRQRLDLAAGVTLVVGPNAQGKSNLLEAVYALSSTRSVRTHREQELIRWGESVARLEAQLEHEQQRWTVELTWQKHGPGLHKRARINRQEVRRFSELFSLVRMVLFSADDLDLITGGPSTRRRFLDYLLCKTEPAYLEALQRYQQVLKQRNEWLRRPVAALGDVYDDQLAECGAILVQRRAELVARLTGRVQHYYSELTAAAEHVTMRFSPSVNDLRPALREARADDLRRQTTTVGPHRDDLDLRLGGDPLRAYGSRGQMRCVAVAMRLAEGEAMQRGPGDTPIYLLDDCMSELDPQRQAWLWRHLARCDQVLVTGVPDVCGHAPAGLEVYDLLGGVLTRREPPGGPEG